MSLFVLLFIAHGLLAQSTLDKGLAEIVKKHNAVGLAVVVVKDKEVAYSRSLGYQNIGKGERLRGNSLFRIASISKSFTATAMMQLVEEGKLSLDDDFGELIGFPVRNPAFPDVKITLRMVLSHTSSINDSNGYFDIDVINPNSSNSKDKKKDKGKEKDWKASYSDYAPGQGYKYCNLNFNMAGAVIERLTGERFDNYLKRRVLMPLGLQSAGYCVDSLDQTRFAQLYEYEEQTDDFLVQPAAYAPRSEEIANYVLGHSTPVFSPTGGLKISAADLASYMQMHMNYGVYDGGQLISRASAEVMQTPIALEDGYGLALEETMKLLPGVRLVGHTGSAYGLYSAMFFNPEEKFGFIVITNGCKAGYDEGYVTLTKDAINFLYRELIKE